MFNDIDKIKLEIAELADKYKLSMALIFGSRASCKTHSGSDIDIAYLSSAPLSLEDESQLALDLAGILKTDLIDLVSIRASSPLLLKEIADNAVVLYESKKSLFSEFRIYSFKKYFESKRLFELRRDYLNKKLGQYDKELKYV